MANEQKREQQTPPREPRQPGAQDERGREESLGRERSEERTARRETTEPARER